MNLKLFYHNFFAYRIPGERLCCRSPVPIAYPREEPRQNGYGREEEKGIPRIGTLFFWVVQWGASSVYASA